MPTTTTRDLEQAVTAMTSLLGPVTDLDWSVPAGDLEWSCWQTAAHVAHDLLAYACQLTARAQDAYLPLDLVVRPSASPAQVLQAVESSAALLRLAVDDADPRARAWHFGLTDPSGFTTMGVTEVVVHTWDVARGLGLDHEPPDDLAQGVLDRLWPHAPRGPAGQVLLWCTGRVALTGHPRTGDWVPPTPAPTGRDDQDW